MKPKAIGQNEKRLAKLLGEAFEAERFSPRILNDFAAFLARRGVLAVSAQTVAGSGAALCLASYDEQRLRVHLRAMARGAK